MRGNIVRWFAVATLLLSAMVAFPAVVRAGTQHVTNCNGSGTGSLPDVVAAAITGDTVIFDLDCKDASAIIPTNGPIMIDKYLTIDGSGHIIVIQRDGLRVTTSVGLRLVDLTFYHVYEGAVGTSLGYSTLVVEGCTFLENNGYALGNGGTAIVTNSTFTGNFNGSAIYSNGTLTVTNSTFSGNRSTGPGGAIHALSNPGPDSIADSVFTGNTAENGGGGYVGGAIYHAGASLIIQRSLFSGNSGESANGGPGGGAVANDGQASMLTITDSTLRGNSAYSGGAISNGGGMVIVNSTLADNAATGKGIPAIHRPYGSGGGIYNYGTLTVTNSTLTGNRVTYAECSALDGGGTLVNSTISGNTAASAGSVCGGRNPLTLINTIVAGNTAPFAPDVINAITSGGHNLIGNTSGASGFVASDLLNIDPRLYALGDNGGPTQTMALYPNSPAIDQIPPSGANCPATDQRGVARPQGTGCDIGAFELSAVIPGQNPAPPPRAAPTGPPPPNPAPPPRGSGASGSGTGPTPNPLPPSR